MVTHDIDEAILLGDRIAVLRGQPRPHRPRVHGRHRAPARRRADPLRPPLRRAAAQDVVGAAGRGRGTRARGGDVMSTPAVQIARARPAPRAGRRAVALAPGPTDGCCGCSRSCSILVAWEIYGRSTNPILFTYPTAVWGAAYNMTGEGILLEAIGQSLLVLGVGLAAGTSWASCSGWRSGARASSRRCSTCRRSRSTRRRWSRSSRCSSCGSASGCGRRS